MRIAAAGVLAACGLLAASAPSSGVSTESLHATQSSKVFFYEEEGAGDAFYASILSPEQRSALRNDLPIDQDGAWQRYYDHLMSTRRQTPMLVFFTTEGGCASLEEPQGEDEDEDQTATPYTSESCDHDLSHLDAIAHAVESTLTAGGFTMPNLRIIRFTQREMPRAFDLHRVPSAPSLMWVPPRSSGRFQRYAHPQTNFLDLSRATIDALLRNRQHPQGPQAAVSDVITSFLRHCFTQSRLPLPSSRSARGKVAVPAVDTETSEDESVAGSLLNLLPFAAIGLYLLLTAFEHRVVVLRVLQSRFTWLVLAQGVVYIALSGFLHSIIHKMPPFYVHPHFGIYFIHPSGRKQFLLEGLVHGGWGFLMSLALFGIADVMPCVRSRLAREEIFRLSLIAVGASYLAVHMIFMMKHPWLAR